MHNRSIRMLGASVGCGMMFRAAAIAILSLIFTFPAFSQDDEDSVPGKVTDAANRAAGTAKLVLDIGQPPTNLGYFAYSRRQQT